MTLEEIKALIPLQGRVAYDVQFRDKRTSLVFIRPPDTGLSGSVYLDREEIASINHHGIIVPIVFSSTSTRELLDLFESLELADTWDDDPLDV